MKFTKLHGCGNGYIYVNLFEEKLDNPAEMSIKVSDHHFGIGSDGLITIGPSEIADFTMHIYNADGSEAEMCGNGVRCVGKYVYDHGLTDKKMVRVETGAGIMVLELNVENGKVATVRVDMGEPMFAPEQIPVVAEGDIVERKRLHMLVGVKIDLLLDPLLFFFLDGEKLAIRRYERKIFKIHRVEREQSASDPCDLLIRINVRAHLYLQRRG